MAEGLGAVLGLFAICWIVPGVAGLATARGIDALAHLFMSVLRLGGGLVCRQPAMWLTGW